MRNVVSTEWEVWQLWKSEINTNDHSRADYHCRGRCQDSSMLTYDAKTELKKKADAKVDAKTVAEGCRDTAELKTDAELTC